MFCPKCGMKLPEDARFCARCGTALGRFLDDDATRFEAQPTAAAHQEATPCASSSSSSSSSSEPYGRIHMPPAGDEDARRPPSPTVVPIDVPIADTGFAPASKDDERKGPATAEEVIGLSESDAATVIRALHEATHALDDFTRRRQTAETANRRWHTIRRGFIAAMLLVIGGAAAIGFATSRWTWRIVSLRGFVIAGTVALSLVCIGMAASSWHAWRIRKVAVACKAYPGIYTTGVTASMSTAIQSLRRLLPQGCRNDAFVNRAAAALDSSPTVGEALLAADRSGTLTLNPIARTSPTAIDIDATVQRLRDTIRGVRAQADDAAPRPAGVVSIILPMVLAAMADAMAVLCCVALTLASQTVARTYYRAGLDDYPEWTPHTTLSDMFLTCEASAHHDGGDIRMTYYPGKNLHVILDGTDASNHVEENRDLAQCVFRTLHGGTHRDEDVVQFFADTAGQPDAGNDGNWSVTSSHYLEDVDLTIETRHDRNEQPDGITDKVVLDIETGKGVDAESVASINTLYASIVRQWAA